VLMLSDEDDFNALASALLEGSVPHRVYRLAPPVGPPASSDGAVAPHLGAPRLFREGLTGHALAGRHGAGERVFSQPATDEAPAGSEVLFLVGAHGRLEPVLEEAAPDPQPGDVAVLVGRVAADKH